LNEPGVRAVSDLNVRLSKMKDAYMEPVRIETTNNFASITHLRIRKTFISEAVDQNANGIHAFCAHW
jgi:hypothetical protein